MFMKWKLGRTRTWNLVWQDVTLCAGFRVYFAFFSQNITHDSLNFVTTSLYSDFSLHLSLVFWVTKAKGHFVGLQCRHYILPSMEYSPRAMLIQIWLGSELNGSQKELNGELELLQCPLWAVDGPRRTSWRRRWRGRTRPRSPPSSTSRWSGGTSWGWTAPPPCCPPCASSGPPVKELLFRNWQKIDRVRMICWYAKHRRILFRLQRPPPPQHTHTHCETTSSGCCV